MKRIDFLKGLVITLLVALMSACSADRTQEIKDLLQTVPADATMVTTIDVEKILKEMDCKVNKGEVEPGKDLAKILDGARDNKLKDFLKQMTKSGMEFSVMAVFMESSRMYATGYINDTDQFRRFVEEDTGDEFSGGTVKICRNYAMSGEQFWYDITDRYPMDEENIKHYKSLSESQSILSNKNARKLLDSKSSITGWIDIKGLLSMSDMGFSERAAATMAMEMAFDDASDIAWNAALNKDEFRLEAEILNSKGGIAKFNFPTDKIDAAVVKKLTSPATGFMAIAINEKMMDLIKNEVNKEGVSMAKIILNMLSCVQGTSACSLGAKNSDGMNAIISTTGRNTSDLMEMVESQGLDVKKNGNDLIISKGEVEGDVEASEAAAAFDGAMFGVLLSGEFIDKDNMKYMSLVAEADKGGLKVKVLLKGADPKRKFLLNMLD